MKETSPSKEEILRRLKIKGDKRLVITPLISVDEQIHNGSVDLRLSNEFIMSRRIKFETIDPSQRKEALEPMIRQFQEKEYTDLGEKIILHPGEFILGATLEYVRLPPDLLGYVLGRSSWGRLGLVIATATTVNPRYSGVITLELANLGTAPITLFPGMRICQIVLHTVEPTKSTVANSKYQISIGPSFSKIYDDEEWTAIRTLQMTNKTP